MIGSMTWAPSGSQRDDERVIVGTCTDRVRNPRSPRMGVTPRRRTWSAPHSWPQPPRAARDTNGATMQAAPFSYSTDAVGFAFPGSRNAAYRSVPLAATVPPMPNEKLLLKGPKAVSENSIISAPAPMSTELRSIEGRVVLPRAGFVIPVVTLTGKPVSGPTKVIAPGVGLKSPAN